MVSTAKSNGNIFSSFFLFVDGILGEEALVVLTNLSPLMVEKTNEPISHMHGYNNGWVSISVARSYS